MIWLFFLAARIDYACMRLAYGWIPAWRPAIEGAALVMREAGLI